MTDWTWVDWTVASLFITALAYVLHRARAIGEQARRREWAKWIAMRSRERGDR